MRSTIITVLLSAGLVFNGTAQLNTTLLGQYIYGGFISDVWGYADGAGNEYALVGRQNGLSIVNVTNPASPVEVHFEPGVSSIWRDIKTYQNYAYVSTEGGGGIVILDLSPLPAPVTVVTVFTGTTYPFSDVHNIFIDEFGKLYIIGSDYGVGGAIITDLTNNPLVPIELGVYNDFYLHDAMARGDTLWGSAIYEGELQAIDVSNPAATVLMGVVQTPYQFTHNAWVSDDGTHVFTTDEQSGAFIAAFNVENLGNMYETDRIRSNPGSGVIVHNTHVINDYLVTSYYKDGITIVDADRPHNIIQVGDYDTSPLAGGGFSGCWGVYPWLPSGNILATDEQEGLFIIGPNYVRGCYLEGTVTDTLCDFPLNNVVIELLPAGIMDTTDLQGGFAFGTVVPGSYTVQFTLPGYNTKTIPVNLVNGVLTWLDVQMYQPGTTIEVSGQIDDTSGTGIANVTVQLEGLTNYTLQTDANGYFNKCDIDMGNYEVSIGKWGYVTYCGTYTFDLQTNNILNMQLESRYYDDFVLDQGWTIAGNATTGTWERDDPIGSTYSQANDANPEDDVVNDCFGKAYITENLAGPADTADVDGGSTVLTSPVFDLSNITDPWLSYYSWFFNADSVNAGENDSMNVYVTNATDTVLLESLKAPNNMSSWQWKEFRLNAFITVNATMQMIVEIADNAPEHILEGGIDVFSIVDSVLIGMDEVVTNEATLLSVYPNPFNDHINISWQLDENEGNVTISVWDITGRVLHEMQLTGERGIVQLNRQLAQGVYFVGIVQQGIIMRIERVVKQ